MFWRLIPIGNRTSIKLRHDTLLDCNNNLERKANQFGMAASNIDTLQAPESGAYPRHLVCACRRLSTD